MHVYRRVKALTHVHGWSTCSEFFMGQGSSVLVVLEIWGAITLCFSVKRRSTNYCSFKPVRIMLCTMSARPMIPSNKTFLMSAPYIRVRILGLEVAGTVKRYQNGREISQASLTLRPQQSYFLATGIRRTGLCCRKVPVSAACS